MNYLKRIKKLIKNKRNSFYFSLMESSGWGGFKNIGRYILISDLKRGIQEREEHYCESYGPGYSEFLDGPGLSCCIGISDALGELIYYGYFDLDDLDSFEEWLSELETRSVK